MTWSVTICDMDDVTNDNAQHVRNNVTRHGIDVAMHKMCGMM